MLLSKEKMSSILLTMGLKRAYKPYWDGEEGHGRIMLETRKPVVIVDGIMSGVEIDVYDDRTIRIWTSQKNKAAQAARDHSLKVRLLDGEAELYIPADKCDLLLHGFGAKVKKKFVVTEKFLQAGRQALAARGFKGPKAALEGLPGESKEVL